jgi:membrane protein DedA with SNARE-associated domain
MNKSTIAGIIRAVLPALVAYAAGKGWDLTAISTTEYVDSLAAVVAGACAVWSVKAKRAANQTEPATK